MPMDYVIKIAGCGNMLKVKIETRWEYFDGLQV